MEDRTVYKDYYPDKTIEQVEQIKERAYYLYMIEETRDRGYDYEFAREQHTIMLNALNSIKAKKGLKDV